MLAALAIVATLWPASGVRAEMSDGDYRSGKAIASPGEQAKVARDLQAQRQHEALEAARLAAEEVTRRQREAQAWARLPPGERMLRERCTACHTLSVMDGKARGTIGWRFTVERMRWWHGARLGPGEPGAIVEHLRAIHPTGMMGSLGELALLAAVLMAALASPVALRRAIRRRRRPM